MRFSGSLKAVLPASPAPSQPSASRCLNAGILQNFHQKTPLLFLKT
ncbi:hypothetical protein AM305_03423, partial [Actinobacillus minor NM305]